MIEAHYVKQQWRGVGCTFVSQHYKDWVVSGIKIVKDALRRRHSQRGSKSPVPTFPSLHFYNNEDKEDIFIGAIQRLVCV